VYATKFAKRISTNGNTAEDTVSMPISLICTSACIIDRADVSKHFEAGGMYDGLATLKSTTVADVTSLPAKCSEKRVTLIEGRAGRGRSTFAQKLCINQSFADKLVIFVSLPDLELKWKGETSIPPLAFSWQLRKHITR
jgi:hypothetical protein